MLFRAISGILLILIGLLQIKLWVSDDGFSEVFRLKAQVAGQRDENRQLAERNKRLTAEVEDLRSGFSALEERARSDLGLIGRHESFFILGRPKEEDQAGETGR